MKADTTLQIRKSPFQEIKWLKQGTLHISHFDPFNEIEVDRLKTVIVLKRSMAPGFLAVDNRLFYKENTPMLFGDAKSSIKAVISQFKEL